SPPAPPSGFAPTGPPVRAPGGIGSGHRARGGRRPTPPAAPARRRHREPRVVRPPDVTPPDVLAGVTVLDFTRVLPGPYCTRLLADLGARVIKIERPGVGDDTRVAPRQLEAGRLDQSTYFVRINAGKRSVAIDLGHPEARGLVLDLARLADVAV